MALGSLGRVPAARTLRWTLLGAMALCLLPAATAPAAESPPPYDGPSPQVYRWVDSTSTGYHPVPTYSWSFLPATATDVTWGTGADPYSASCIPLGFSFPLEGATHDCVWVHENGFLVPDVAANATTPSGSVTPIGPFPDSQYPPRMVAAYLADMVQCGGQWRTLTQGSAPTRTFTVEFNHTAMVPASTTGSPTLSCLPPPCGPTGCVGSPTCSYEGVPCRVSTFQVRLHEGTGAVTVLLNDVGPAPTTATYSGGPAAMGLQNGASYGLGYDSGSAGLAYTARAVRYYPDRLPAPNAVAPVALVEDGPGSPMVFLGATDADNDAFRLCLGPATGVAVTTSIPSCGAVTAPSPGAAGLDGPSSVILTPLANFCGAGSLRFRAVDEVGRLGPNASVPVDVACRNDPPQFSLAAPCNSMVVAMVGVPANIAACVGGVSAAPAGSTGEDNQAITFTRMSMSANLFVGGLMPTLTRDLAQPTTGRLTFTATVAGLTQACFRAADNNLKPDGTPYGASEQQGTAPFSGTPYPCVTIGIQAPGPADSDWDGVPDMSDNCPSLPNTNQANLDGDSMGDACDVDRDGDGVADTSDNCPSKANPTQADWDQNGAGDACDTLPPYPCQTPPHAAFSATTTEVNVGQPVGFRDRSTGTPAKLWTWDFGDGFRSTSPAPSHAFASQGTYLVMLMVAEHADCPGRQATLTIVVNPYGNDQGRNAGTGGGVTTPMANAGPDRTVAEGEEVTLTGGAIGRQATDLVYLWKLAEGPAGYIVPATEGRDLRFAAPMLGAGHAVRLVFELRVMQAGSLSEPDEVSVLVVPANRAPLARAGPPLDAVRGQVATLDASSSSDPDGDVLRYSWVVAGGEPVTLRGEDTPTPRFDVPAHSAGAAGFTDVRLSVSDGRWVSTDTVRVWFLPADRAPLAFAAEPDPGDPLRVTFRLQGGPVSQSWMFGDGTSSQAADPVHTYTAPGTYQVTVVATFADGRAATETRQVEVRDVAAHAAARHPGLAAAWPLAVVLAGTALAGMGTWALMRRIRDA